MTAAAPQRVQISPLFEKPPPPPGSDQWMRWFQNVKCGEKFDARTNQTDFSLQLAISIQNFWTWRDEGSKIRADRYGFQPLRARVKDASVPKHLRPLSDAQTPEIEIRRDYQP
jgi:hypothetical protein